MKVLKYHSLTSSYKSNAARPTARYTASFTRIACRLLGSTGWWCCRIKSTRTEARTSLKWWKIAKNKDSVQGYNIIHTFTLWYIHRIIIYFSNFCINLWLLTLKLYFHDSPPSSIAETGNASYILCFLYLITFLSHMILLNANCIIIECHAYRNFLGEYPTFQDPQVSKGSNAWQAWSKSPLIFLVWKILASIGTPSKPMDLSSLFRWRKNDR